MVRKGLFAIFTAFVISFIGTASIQAEEVTEEKIDDVLISNAKTHLGSPYLFGGTSHKGFDCSGFSQIVFKETGIDIPRTAGEQYKIGTAVKKEDLKKGDLIFFETISKGPSHLGIYIGDNKFIHAASSNGVSISNLNDPYYWGPRYYGAKRVL